MAGKLGMIWNILMGRPVAYRMKIEGFIGPKDGALHAILVENLLTLPPTGRDDQIRLNWIMEHMA